LPEIEIPARWASAQATSVQTLVDATGIVFVGTVTSDLGTVERAPGQSDLKAKVPVSSFETRVESSIVGNLAPGAVVTIEQLGGTAQTETGDAVVQLEKDEMLEVGVRYLFFAGAKESGALSSPPFGRFRIEDGRIAPLDDWLDTPVARGLAGESVVEGTASIRSVSE
jgi:hypothetical protein